METGIYGAAPQWARISVIMVVASWHDALAADQLPREIVGNWCVAIEQMLREQTYPYRRCQDSNWDIIVRWDGFDAQETSCELNTIKRQGAAWLASFGCSGAGLTWLEEDEIRVGKDGWTLEAKIKNVRRVGDPIRYCLGNKCGRVPRCFRRLASKYRRAGRLALFGPAPLFDGEDTAAYDELLVRISGAVKPSSTSFGKRFVFVG